MEIGLGHMRLRPADFWALSLPEWRAATMGYRESVTGERSGPGGETMDRAALEALMEAHPDGR
jgi:uncharacterized phage protein (TIGR02216 family)